MGESGLAREHLREAIALMVASMTAGGASEVDASPPERRFEEIADLPVLFDPRFQWQPEGVDAVGDLERVLASLGSDLDLQKRLQRAGAGARWDDVVTSIGAFEAEIWRCLQSP